MDLPFETSQLDFLALNFVFGEVSTVKSLPLYETKLLGNAIKPCPSLSEVCILAA